MNISDYEEGGSLVVEHSRGPASQNSNGSAEIGSNVEKAAGQVGVGSFAKCTTVLLAEERTIVREGMGALLELKEDISVVGHASSFTQVAPLAEKLKPDVVIVAFSMALKNGVQAIRRLLGRLCGARMLVLVPNGDDAFGEHIAAAGAAGYLSEEASSQALAIAVRKVHATARCFPPGVGWRSEMNRPFPFLVNARGKNGASLTPREWEVLQLIAEGNANKQAAAKMNISIKTVEKHRQHLMEKLCLHETASLTRFAVHAGIVR